MGQVSKAYSCPDPFFCSRREFVKRYTPKGYQLKGRDGDTDQDGVADAKGQVAWLIDGSKVEACAEDASQGENDHEAPAGRSAEAMTNSQEDGDGEGWEVEHEEENGHPVTIVQCHFLQVENQR